MGTRELREAFNAVAQPIASCETALLRYGREGALECQLLEFSGSYADGVGFQIRSASLGPEVDVVAAAGETAKLLLKQRV